MVSLKLSDVLKIVKNRMDFTLESRFMSWIILPDSGVRAPEVDAFALIAKEVSENLMIVF